MARAVALLVVAALCVVYASAGTNMRGVESTAPLGSTVGQFDLASANTQDDFVAMWHRFASVYRRAYNPMEKETRLKTFVANVEFMKQANAAHPDMTMGVNEFADLSFAEFEETLLHPDVSSFGEDVLAAAPVFVPTVASAADLPASVDWVKEGAVTPAKDQGACGSCWSFSTTGALEGAHAIKSGKLEVFSEQLLLDCDHTDGKCQGGFPWTAMDWVLNESSGKVALESDYPYQCADQYSSECTSSKCDATKATVQLEFKTTRLPQADETALLEATATEGPIAVGITATRYLQHYTGGVLKDTTCGTAMGTMNHAVLVTGYDADTITVKNSWKNTWGEDGFVRFQRGVNQCGVANMASYPKMA